VPKYFPAIKNIHVYYAINTMCYIGMM